MKLNLLPEKPALRNAIRIDPAEDYDCGVLDECNIAATVCFRLYDTNALIETANRIRYDEGRKPLQPFDDLTDADCDLDSWYNFYITVDNWNQFVRPYICVMLDSGCGEEWDCDIELTLDQCRIIRQILDEDCYAYYGKPCADLLNEAVEEAACP